MPDRGFSGKVKVASSIVDYLSSGLYESPAACMKELVNNSFDADASRVDIHVKPEADRIIVSDDGTGLSRKEFEDHFGHVSESHKRDSGDKTAKGRPKVGRIGIGFIAANELCEEMEIVSTKKGSTDLLRVTVDFRKMRDPQKQRKDKQGNVTKGDYRGIVDKAGRNEHYTRIYLNEVRANVRDVMVGATPKANTAGEDSLYGRGPGFIADRLGKPGLRTWGDLNLYSQTMLKVGLNVPVRYAPKWMPANLQKRLSRLEEEVEELEFVVKWDGTDLRKPVVLGRDDAKLPHVLRRFTFAGQHVRAQGYLFAQHGIIEPAELNGLLIRIRNAAVGEYDSSFLGFRASEYQVVKRWVSGEIWASSELEEALNIDRRTLREAHPAFVELQAAVHQELSSFFKEARKTLYDDPSRERKDELAVAQSSRIEEIAQRHRLSVPSVLRPPPAPKRKKDSKPRKEPSTPRSLSRKYSASELYELALEVAEEELPRELFRKFAKALARRMSR
jgi:hypothetical protein